MPLLSIEELRELDNLYSLCPPDQYENELSITHEKASNVCKFFNAGNCKYGESCKLFHTHLNESELKKNVFYVVSVPIERGNPK